MSSETTGEQQPPERPVRGDDTSESDAEQRRDALAAISVQPGDRKTDNVGLLVIEAELASLEGKQLDNPAKPHTESVGEAFQERLDKHDEDLVPAWTRPWEADE